MLAWAIDKMLGVSVDLEPLSLILGLPSRAVISPNKTGLSRGILYNFLPVSLIFY